MGEMLSQQPRRGSPSNKQYSIIFIIHDEQKQTKKQGNKNPDILYRRGISPALVWAQSAIHAAARCTPSLLDGGLGSAGLRCSRPMGTIPMRRRAWLPLHQCIRGFLRLTGSHGPSLDGSDARRRCGWNRHVVRCNWVQSWGVRGVTHPRQPAQFSPASFLLFPRSE
ncbi:hypothetical protein BO78DRAFT_29298 [Aspergillus sclerotiicarbonarius CBS 121057]|uniref:Uncharacterized protein n=1 Tax=Aspergillus sclerotiicarbonarius (strain CBS 121057 / IBT 28362) TaxID=1448318 RepID=A0A319EJ89_ASPSB|nr:hypothetical protein BO78DRAFT_29298 [Aspergillus sclerotiicarbonarius CBS 121057]